MESSSTVSQESFSAGNLARGSAPVRQELLAVHVDAADYRYEAEYSGLIHRDHIQIRVERRSQCPAFDFSIWSSSRITRSRLSATMVKLMSTDIEDYIREKLALGKFQTREAFFEIAVRLYRELEIHKAARREARKRARNLAAGSVGQLTIAGIKSQLGSEFSDSC